MKKMIPGRNIPTIKQKLIVLVVGHLLLFSVLIYSLFFWFQSVMEEKISALALQTIETVVGNIEVYIGNTIRQSDTIASDGSVGQLIRNNPDFSDASSIWPLVQIQEKLQNYAIANPFIYSISIFNQQSGKVLSSIDGIYNAPVSEMNWVDKVMSRETPTTVGAGFNGIIPTYSQVKGQLMISVLRTMTGRVQNNILIVNTDKQVLDLAIGDLDSFKGMGIKISNYEGEVFYSKGSLPSEALDPVPNPSSQPEDRQPFQTLLYGSEKYIVANKFSSITNWNVSMIIPHHEIMRDVTSMMQATILVLGLITLLVLLLFGIVYVQIINPIKRLMQGMVTVEKGLTFKPIPIKRMDELGFLQKRFNEMVVNEQQMRNTILEEQLNKKEIELKFLQSQVNPHFLYNTLDSIYWVAEQSGVEEISDIVLDLSKFFRISLSKGRDFITIEQMVQHLQYYLRIQQFRHIGKFKVVWDVDPHYAGVEVMNLMLQPVVENAIIHGLERTVEDCLLTIRIGSEDDWLFFSVEDTGVGIDEQKVRHLLQEITQNEGPSGASYGMRNLYQRLQILYGVDMQFSIWSKPQEGTNVTIRIKLSRLKGEAA